MFNPQCKPLLRNSDPLPQGNDQRLCQIPRSSTNPLSRLPNNLRNASSRHVHRATHLMDPSLRLLRIKLHGLRHRHKDQSHARTPLDDDLRSPNQHPPPNLSNLPPQQQPHQDLGPRSRRISIPILPLRPRSISLPQVDLLPPTPKSHPLDPLPSPPTIRPRRNPPSTTHNNTESNSLALCPANMGL